MKDLAKYLGKFLADGIDRTHDAGLPMDFTAKGLTSVIKIGLGNYESKLKASHTKLAEAARNIASIFPESDMDELDAADFRDRAMMTFDAAKKAEQALAEAEL